MSDLRKRKSVKIAADGTPPSGSELNRMHVSLSASDLPALGKFYVYLLFAHRLTLIDHQHTIFYL